ncbi:MAG: redoxin family protein [bacterium]
MAIEIGSTIPDTKIMIATADGPNETQTVDLFSSKKTALFSLPGAFTPTCSAQHLPGFLENASKLKNKNIDQIVCMSVNDAFVMWAWALDQKAQDDIIMLADGNAEFAQNLGLAFDGSMFGMGKRAQRFSMIIDNNVVEKLFVEEPGAYEVSSAEYMLAVLS